MNLRSSVRSVLGWAFGISLSILFISLWGRAVVVDTDALGESLAPLSGSQTVSDFVAGWMADEMVDSGVDPEMVEPTVDRFMGSSGLGDTLDRLVVEVVQAAASTDPGGSSIDMRAMVAPAVPEMVAGLSDLGFPVSEDSVTETVTGFDPLVIREPGSSAIVGSGSRAASRLGTASALAAVAMVGLGGGVVAMSGDRVTGLRGLLNRVAIGGLSFALLLRLGSWIADPGGGRAPVPETLSNLVGSKWIVPLQVATLAGLVTGAIYVTRRLLKRRGASPSRDEPPIPREERQESLSRSH
jgi:hypothetical protein